MYNITNNRLFILGAGFSAEANIPLMNRLLPLAMAKFSSECPSIYERVENYARECFFTENNSIDYSGNRLSELCTFLEYIELREYGGGERWSSNGSREKLVLDQEDS